jgi:hypothetical protein
MSISRMLRTAWYRKDSTVFKLKKLRFSRFGDALHAIFATRAVLRIREAASAAESCAAIDLGTGWGGDHPMATLQFRRGSTMIIMGAEVRDMDPRADLKSTVV